MAAIEPSDIKDILKELHKEGIETRFNKCAKKWRIHSKSFIHKVIIINEPSNTKFNFKKSELLGIIAHELVHMDERHELIYVLTTLLVALLGFVTSIWLIVNSYLNISYTIALWFIVLLIYYIIIRRYLEKRADIIAARKIGKTLFKRSLRKLWEIGIPEDCLIHGTFSSRIKRLYKFA